MKKKSKQTVTILGSEQEIIDYTILPGKMKKGRQLCFFKPGDYADCTRNFAGSSSHLIA